MLHYYPFASSGFLVHSTTRNAPYIHQSHDSILELWRTFTNASDHFYKIILNSGNCFREEAF